MALSNIKITEGQGGTSRELTSNDNKSGFVFYGSTAVPSPFSGETSVTVFSLSEAEAKGIVSTTYPIPHYHISEFYRVNNSGQMQVAIVNYSGGTHNFNEVKTLVENANGEVNQIGVYTDENFSTGMVSQLQTVLTDLKTDDTPCIGVLAANFTGFTLSSLPDLSQSTANLVSVVIGQDGGNKGKALFSTLGQSITALGATLGAISRSSVHESIAWKGQFNLAGTELDTLAFANGTSYKGVTKAQLAQVNDKNYLFLLKDYGLNGSFFNSSSTAIGATSDYLTIERNRTINKARRLLRTALLPELNSPLYLDEDGKLRIETIAKFTSLCEQAISNMRVNGELSNFEVFINRDQNVLADDTLDIEVKLQPVGVARFINISLGYTVAIA